MIQSSTKGSVLVYIVVLLLLFGVLGVIMTSLFTTSTSSSATPNQGRRADYVTESAMRYAFSELRNSDFDPAVINTLNTTTYNVSPEGSFTLNIFSPSFEASTASTGTQLTLKTSEGEMPASFNIPLNAWVVNLDYLALPLPSAQVVSWLKIDNTTLSIVTNSAFPVNQDERICLAVKPYGVPDTNIVDGDSLEVQTEARVLFPESDGAINIRGIDYVYKKRVDNTDSVTLESISASSMPNRQAPFPINNLLPDEFIVLSPRNYIVIPTGTSDTVTVIGTLDTALNIYNLATIKPITRKPDIDFERENLSTALSQNETNSAFINVDNDNKIIDVGGGEAIKTNPEFGSTWFQANENIGGETSVCNAGACEFRRGVRIFFTLDYTGTADGFTLSLINAAHNTISSSGGDVAMGELLGYAGDSRKVVIAANATVDGAAFLDGTGAGLQPPKMAMEFDTFTNRDTLNYCQGTTTQINSSRNDPFDHNRDAVQFDFWGFTSLTMPCRDYWLSGTKVIDHGSYDDNRHDSGELNQPWTPYATAGDVRSTPAVAGDGTIYVGSDDGHLYAINPDGSLKWKSVSIGQVRSSPAVGSNGVVYVGTDNGWVYAFAKDATDPFSHAVLYSYPTFGAVKSSPVIGAGGKVYVGSDDTYFYGFAPNLAKLWQFHTAGPLSFGRPAIGPNGILYVSHRSSSTGKIYALNPAQRELDPAGIAFPGENEWEFDLGTSSDGSQYMPGVDPTTGTIYSDRSDGKLVAVTPGGIEDWEFYLGSDFDSTPVVGADGTVYFGADDSRIYAINPADRKADITENTLNSSREWSYLTGGPVRTKPAIGQDGTVLAVSNGSKLYAVNPDGTLKWTFSIPVDTSSLVSSPTVGNEGIVYVGSSDNKLYAINNFAVPRNFKDKAISSVNDGGDIKVAGEIVSVDDELDWLEGDKLGSPPLKGPWAIRLEVMRSLTQNAHSKYEYTLHAWIRQCDSAACTNILGTFYEDTRIEYAATPDLDQTIELSAAENTDFTRFLFGFTGATGAGTWQSAGIGDFKLSFIRENDPIAP